MHQMTTDSPSNQSRRNGIVIAAIGLQLLLCSIASAANAAGDSFDRSARRLPAQVAQALREIVDRSATPSHGVFREDAPGFSLSDTPTMIAAANSEHHARPQLDIWSRRTLNLPPPARS
jgi:hypothetical protein